MRAGAHLIPEIFMMSFDAKEDPKLLIIIVLYKCEIDKSDTVKSLIECNQVIGNSSRIVVWDNSPIAQRREILDEIGKVFSDFHYVFKGENSSLAKVYNTVIFNHSANCDFVNIWDQDSKFDDLFFSSFNRSLALAPTVELFVPKVFYGSSLESPGLFSYFKGRKFKDSSFSGVTSIRNTIAIISGVIINIKLLEKAQFDERLKLYGIDTKFFLDCAKYTNHVFVLNYTLKHELSAYSKEDLKLKLFRFGDFSYSSLVICRDISIASFSISVIHLFFLALKNTIQFKSMKFIGVFCKIIKTYMKEYYW